MGSDFYETPSEKEASRRQGRPLLGIGANTVIENAIVDKNVRIGRNVRIVNREHVRDAEETPYAMIRDGIVVIPKGTVIPDGIVI
jgi:glucose-1-phosphate adenylyltransferase